MTEIVTDLAARCAVALYDGEDFLGSGFLAAPGQVLTCAHVAAGCKGLITARRAEGGDLHERPDRPRRMIPPEKGAEPTWAPPDLALIFVGPQPDQPFVWLADQAPAAGSDVVCLGFSKKTPGAGVTEDSAWLKVAAPSGGGGLVKVQQGAIPEGMSGSLVLNHGTLRVCGMVKASRDVDADRGGWIIPFLSLPGPRRDRRAERRGSWPHITVAAGGDQALGVRATRVRVAVSAAGA